MFNPTWTIISRVNSYTSDVHYNKLLNVLPHPIELCPLCRKCNSYLTSKRVGVYFIAQLWNFGTWKFIPLLTIISRVNLYTNDVHNNYLLNVLPHSINICSLGRNVYWYLFNCNKGAGQFFTSHLFNFDPWKFNPTWTFISRVYSYTSDVRNNNLLNVLPHLIDPCPLCRKGDSYLASEREGQFCIAQLWNFYPWKF